ncbi:helix-turn-helix transcriptional regulator [Lactobacillus crispatus]|uniref:helix-turn-helix transcriptional regulator n=1 Tax=Lactobacillus crispatus TaxID=47770 RepID=UPI00105B8BB2|nr:helix-turn-helix transcriptional regulator [Lactobacillus crispatus]TDN08197.1 transcriptional regulator [Lactobacillus crispatus]
MSLYTAVKKVAGQNHKSIYQIEHDLQLSNGMISKWDRSMPRADSLQDVADYLGVTTQFLFKLARENRRESKWKL